MNKLEKINIIKSVFAGDITLENLNPKYLSLYFYKDKRPMIYKIENINVSRDEFCDQLRKQIRFNEFLNIFVDNVSTENRFKT